MPTIKQLKDRIYPITAYNATDLQIQKESRKKSIQAYLKAINYGDNRDYPKIRFYFGETAQTSVTTWAKDVFTAKVARELSYPDSRKPSHVEKD